MHVHLHVHFLDAHVLDVDVLDVDVHVLDVHVHSLHVHVHVHVHALHVHAHAHVHVDVPVHLGVHMLLRAHVHAHLLEHQSEPKRSEPATHVEILAAQVAVTGAGMRKQASDVADGLETIPHRRLGSDGLHLRGGWAGDRRRSW